MYYGVTSISNYAVSPCKFKLILSLTYLRRNTISSYGVAFNVLNKFVSLSSLRRNTIFSLRRSLR